MASCVPDPTDIKIYYKPRVGFDGTRHLSWIPFNPDQPAPGELEYDDDGNLIQPRSV